LSGTQEAFVRDARVARLATTGPDGPHVVAVCPALRDDRTLVFATELTTVKLANLRHEPRCCLAFDEYDEDWSKLKQVVLWGTAEIVDSGERWKAGRELLYEKFPQYPVDAPIELGDSAIVQVRIERVSGDV
jgi:nitroimidazol reductase NimA-like FMN-containing flavoprotein (pyridoxamine 5'-phosphate oxidase superfamily)